MWSLASAPAPSTTWQLWATHKNPQQLKFKGQHAGDAPPYNQFCIRAWLTDYENICVYSIFAWKGVKSHWEHRGLQRCTNRFLFVQNSGATFMSCCVHKAPSLHQKRKEKYKHQPKKQLEPRFLSFYSQPERHHAAPHDDALERGSSGYLDPWARSRWRTAAQVVTVPLHLPLPAKSTLT